jgi:gluconolactonase
MNRRHLLPIVGFFLLFGCKPAREYKSVGSVEKIDPSLDQIISSNKTPELLAEGFTWSEGPVWVESQKMLLFSDVPQDTVYKWTEDDGKEVYLTPSGYTGSTPSTSKEKGANGLIINKDGKLVLCQHGDRRIAIMTAPLDKPNPTYETLAGKFDGKRFDSPNDVVADGKGNYYFTDPPYGLGEHEKDPGKEIPFQGVYKLASNGKVYVLVDTITKPNGIALTPDGKGLMVASSDPARARWYKYELGDSGVMAGKIFYDATSMTKDQAGLPDGMKIDKNGNVFASGPGGILIFNSDAKLLGQIKLPTATANCALSADEKTLYITSKNTLLRLRMR